MSRQTILLSALGAILVIALWWLFLYSPGQERLAGVEEEIAATEAEADNLRAQIARLEAVRAIAPELEADLAAVGSIVPVDPALPGALRQLQAAADDAGVTLSQVTTTRPTVLDEAVGLHTITLSMGVSGSYFQVVDFLRRVEDPAITARGIEFQTLTLAPAEYPTLQVTIGATMFALLEPVPGPEAAAEAGAAEGEAAEGEAAEGEAADEAATDDGDGGDQ